MSLPSEHPMTKAREMVYTMQADRVAAEQIKEFVSVAELLELLGITDGELNNEVARRYPATSEKDR